MMDEAIVILQEKWIKILEHWRMTRERALCQDEMVELQSNIQLLQKQLKALLSLNGLLEKMWEYERELNQLNRCHQQEGNEDIKKKISGLFTERTAMCDEMREMCIDERFLASYLEKSTDYRQQNTLPLPDGFMCHKEYAAELKFLKASLCFEETGSKNEMLQSFCDLQAMSQVLAPPPPLLALACKTLRMLQDKKMHALMIESINKGLDLCNGFRRRLFCLLHEIRPVNSLVFHQKCKSLLQVENLSMHCLCQSKRGSHDGQRWMDNMENTRMLQMKLEESHEH